MIVDKQGYLGFTYNGKHSSEFNIIRVSDGSRFNESLLPTIQDKTIQVPGAAGKIFQRADYDVRTFSIQIAYDNMSEKNLQEMKKWLGDKRVHPLVFDELPYKTWYAKVTGNASMKWLPFGNKESGRVYKGEGTIQFTCYDPFAHCKHDWVSKWLEKWLDERYEGDENKITEEEWWDASGLRLDESQSILSIEISEEQPAARSATYVDSGFQISNGLLWGKTTLEIINNHLSAVGLNIKDNHLWMEASGDRPTQCVSIEIHNVGDMDADFCLQIDGTENIIPASAVLLTAEVGNTETVVGIFVWEKIDGTSKAKINSKIQLIEGMDSNGEKTGLIYDISTGAYFKLPKQDSESELTYKLWLCSKDNITATLNYDYLYF